jgi:hypothetical protein
MKPNDLALSAIVDKLASVNAQLKELNDEAKALKDLLITSGLEVVESAAYKAVVKFTEPAPSVDYKKVVELLEVEIPKRVLNKATKVRAPYYSVALYDL